MNRPDENMINAMCLTWRHDFGLPSPAADAEGRMAWSDGFAMGMSEQQKEGLRLQMRQIYEHHIKPAILAAVEEEREACALVPDAYADLQRQAWEAFKASGSPGPATSFEALFRLISEAIRNRKGA